MGWGVRLIRIFEYRVSEGFKNIRSWAYVLYKWPQRRFINIANDIWNSFMKKILNLSNISKKSAILFENSERTFSDFPTEVATCIFEITSQYQKSPFILYHQNLLFSSFLFLSFCRKYPSSPNGFCRCQCPTRLPSELIRQIPWWSNRVKQKSSLLTDKVDISFQFP